MTTAETTASLDGTSGTAIRWINRGLELLWLLTVVAVPLAFVDRDSFLSELELAYVDVPKTVLLRTLVGLMAILWLSELFLRRRNQLEYSFTGRRQRLGPEAWLRILSGWLRSVPNRWVTLAVVIYLGSILLSTALSESFNVSMWGLVPGQDTYPAYTIICYVVLFGVVATHVNTTAQVVRLLWAISFMGVLVGGYSWAQFYGHDVFNLREIPGGQLLGSTLGNSILAGSLLLMTITVSLVAATLALGQPVRNGRFLSKAAIWTLILTIQITALIFTSARGPWGGAVVGLVPLLGLVAAFAGWSAFVRMALVLGLAVGLSVAVILVPPPIPTGEPVQIDAGHLFPAPAEISLSTPISDQFNSLGRGITGVGRGVGAGGLSGRIGIWEASGRLITERPWFESKPLKLPALRYIVGYGPDMFKYTYLLERVPRGPNRVLISERFAHNFLIHQGVELGIFGLLTTLGLFAAPVIVGGYQLFHRGRSYSTLHKLLLIGILAAFAGRFVEQMVGVAAVSDLTIFWVLLGLFAALPTVARGPRQSADSASSPQLEQRRRRVPARNTVRTSGLQTALPVLVAVCLIAGIGAITWNNSINYLEAGFKARDGLNEIRAAEFQNAQVSLNMAIDLAPDVPVYHTLRAAVYSGYRRQESGPREPECDRLADGGTPYEVCLARMNYLSHREAAKQRPLDWRPRLDLAGSALTLALMNRDADKANEATRQYREVAQLDPQAWWHWEWLAAASINVGQFEAALEPLEKSLALLEGRPRSALSRLLQGMAYLQLDEPATALRSFDEAIRLNPKLFDAYANRGASYNALGQYQRAIRDLDEAINLNPEMAMAYNNRGNSYGNLDQLERAIEDYGEAIRLDSRFVLAYSNRALAYTYLGRDDDAQADVERGTELGLDPELLLAKILEAKNAR